MNFKKYISLFLEPVPSSPKRHHRGTTVSSIASSIVGNLVTRPRSLCRWYVVYVRHLTENFSQFYNFKRLNIKFFFIIYLEKRYLVEFRKVHMKKFNG
jgi:hypothetical protein